MSRKIKTFEIEGRKEPITVKELTVGTIISIAQNIDLENLSLVSFVKFADETFLPECVNLTLEQFKEMAPSEIESIYNKFMEVNKSFFVLAQKMGFQEMLDKMRKAIMRDFLSFVVGSFNPAIPES